MTEQEIQPTSLHAARAAAEKFVESGGDVEAEPTGPDVEEAPETDAGSPAQEGEDGQGETESPPEPGPNHTVTLGDGKEVEMTQEELFRNARLGLLAGDEEFLQAARNMETFVAENPEAQGAFEAILRNPEISRDVVRRFAAIEETGTADSNSQANSSELNELKQQLAALQAQVEGSSQVNVEDEFIATVKSRASGYPALQALPQNVLADAVQARLAKGESLTGAIANLATQMVNKGAEEAGELAAKAAATRNLQGLGDAKGSAATSVAPPSAMTGDDLNDGRVAKATKEYLRSLR